MGHPVTTDPLVIMVINMTVVFLVLIMLMYVIKLSHFIDPTKERAEAAAEVQEAAPAPPAPVVEPEVYGIPDEVVAVIAAAVASSGGGDIRVIRPLGDSGWRGAGRMEGIGAR